MKYELERDTSGLTARDREAFTLAVQGKTMKEIAEDMGIHRSRAGQLVKGLVDRGFLRRNDAGRIVRGPEKPLCGRIAAATGQPCQVPVGFPGDPCGRHA